MIAIAEPPLIRADPGGVLAERASSPGLLLGLLGQEAMHRLRAAHAAVGVSPRQFHLLGLLADEGAMTQTELGRALRVDKSVIVSLLNPLEHDGLITRERDADDRRRHRVSLTAAGGRQLDRAARAQSAADDELFAGLTAEQRHGLAAALLSLRDSLAVGACPTEAP
jgi:DNA-binding MarR family transcriptional regulator